jgi:methylmalonyl-CoA/ethylmalonyl-CoA epimerase
MFMPYLNHIGIAVSDLESITRLFSLLGFDVHHVEPVPEQGVTTHFLPLPLAPSSLELLVPTDPQGSVSRFIQKRGPGIHHLSFTVGKGELQSMSSRLREAGYQLIYAEARAGAHQMQINFIHPSSSGGILIELMEPAEVGKTTLR